MASRPHPGCPAIPATFGAQAVNVGGSNEEVSRGMAHIRRPQALSTALRGVHELFKLRSSAAQHVICVVGHIAHRRQLIHL